MRRPFREAVQVKYLTDKVGVYLHFPFCAKKCAYCNFYSAVFTDVMCDAYTDALISEIKKWGGRVDRPIDTIYIGGGTPSLLGRRIGRVLSSIRQSFDMQDDAEITVEANPDSCDRDFLDRAAAAGVNRLSLGVQSGDDKMLEKLGRSHSFAQAEKAVGNARAAGFKNVSVDLMTALPDSNAETLRNDIDAICGLCPEHISAYILKAEPHTVFGRGVRGIPDDDCAAEQYLFTCEELQKRGYRQYEISNFAKNGFESRHNLKYWRCEEYIGIGPSAHSFFGGERFYCPSDLKGFISAPKIVSEGAGGGKEERLMLALRLSEGTDISLYGSVSGTLEKFLCRLKKERLIEKNGTHISLTARGMAVSNSIITEITELLYENI